MLRSQSGRWIVIVISPVEATPRQWFMASRTIWRASAADAGAAADSEKISHTIVTPRDRPVPSNRLTTLKPLDGELIAADCTLAYRCMTIL
jgi:hypothetical protein